MTIPVDPHDDRIDILLATYNGERFLAEQLDSLVAQTHENWRIIVRDDGSSDGTVAILEAFRERHPDKVLFIEDDDGNLGLIRNFSRLMERSDAPYAAFCDQDDVWIPEKLAVSLARIHALEKECGADTPLLVFSDLKIVDENLQPIHLSFWRYQRVTPVWSNEFNRVLIQNMVTGCTTLMNRQLCARACPIPEAAAYHDWWTVLVAATFGKSGYCSQPTVYYRQHMQNVVGTRTNRTTIRQAFVMLRNRHRYKEATRHRFIQAALFQKQFGELLNRADAEVLEGFIDFRDEKIFKRFRLAVRHRFLPFGWASSCYFLFVSFK